MKFLLVFAALFLVSAQATWDDEDERSYLADWSDGRDLNQEKLPLSFEHFLQRNARKPRPQQFYGLMGKRDAGFGPFSRKRTSEWNIPQLTERRRK